MINMNGKEMPNASFLKFTAHSFEKYLKERSPQKLKLFAVKSKNKNYEFWKRDPFPLELLKKETISQKLDYIHYNPLAGKWMLAKEPEGYYYSSAKFYETGTDDFGF